MVALFPPAFIKVPVATLSVMPLLVEVCPSPITGCRVTPLITAVASGAAPESTALV
jgi:hypothetical protein